MSCISTGQILKPCISNLLPVPFGDLSINFGTPCGLCLIRMTEKKKEQGSVKSLHASAHFVEAWGRKISSLLVPLLLLCCGNLVFPVKKGEGGEACVAE